jgi:hypothetical protein
MSDISCSGEGGLTACMTRRERRSAVVDERIVVVEEAQVEHGRPLVERHRFLGADGVIASAAAP